jgi:hypothetical protein
MKRQPLAGPLPLEQDSVCRLADARGWVLTGLEGIVWVTASGVAEDIFLTPGDCYRIPNAGLVLLESIAAGVVRLAPPQ